MIVIVWKESHGKSVSIVETCKNVKRSQNPSAPFWDNNLVHYGLQIYDNKYVKHREYGCTDNYIVICNIYTILESKTTF